MTYDLWLWMAQGFAVDAVLVLAMMWDYERQEQKDEEEE